MLPLQHGTCSSLCGQFVDEREVPGSAVNGIVYHTDALLEFPQLSQMLDVVVG